MTEVMLVLVGTFGFLGLAALAFVWHAGRAAPAAPAEPAGPSQPRPPEHVHTYRLRSNEETAGDAVDVWRCADCGDIQRWVRVKRA
jgi:hypothetical protein